MTPLTLVTAPERGIGGGTPGRAQRVAILGSTGSIGTNALDVIRRLEPPVQVVALAAGRRWEDLARQCQTVRPRYAVVADATLRDEVDPACFPRETELRFGAEAVLDAAASDEVDTVLAAIVGAAGLHGTWAAVEAGKRVCLANKETLVVAGPLVIERARRSGAVLLPVDSEHSAVFQALACGRPDEVRRIVLTASGGPFRRLSRDELARVSPSDALAHPTWKMGPKITVDSATLMNKALEVIEARWLFDLPAERIDVVVHPQSIVHSFVEFVDGSTVAQLSPPDMRLPIQYALTWPERRPGPAPRIDWRQAQSWEFEAPDLDRFPGLALGYTVARLGGTAGAVLNAANEVAVARFLRGDMRFLDIPAAVKSVLEAHPFDPHPALADLLRLDRWAREEMQRWTR